MGVQTITSLLLLLCALSLVKANPTGSLEQSDVGSYLSDPGVPSSGYLNGEVLAQLLSAPSQAYPGPHKRQWCSKGMTYNYVIGACRMSFAAMRGRGRG